MIDASRPGTVNVTEFTTAIAAAHVITVSAASILIDTPVNISGLGGGHRLNLRTDSGSGYGLGPITFNSRINLASNDQLYLSGSAIDECGTSASVEGGHLAINAYLFGVGVQSEPAEFIVSHLSGFSLVTRGSAPARIISSGELPLEEFDHGMPDSQNAIFTNGLLQIELLQTPAAHSFRDPTHSLRKKGAHI